MKGKIKIKDITYIAIFSAVITLCAWITIPFTIPFTLQTFAIYSSLYILGGKKGTYSIIVYVLLGIIGIPVFSGFKGGIGALLGNTGGYILGFILIGVVYTIMTHFSSKTYMIIIASIISLIVCYAFGTAWFMYLYTNNSGSIQLITVLSKCVIPFIIPDTIKIFLAWALSHRIKKYII